MCRSGCRYCDRERRPRSPDQCPRRIRLLFRQRRDLDGNRICMGLRRRHRSKGFFPVLSRRDLLFWRSCWLLLRPEKKGKARTGWALCSRSFRRGSGWLPEKAPAPETTTGQRLIALLTPGHPARYALARDMKRTPGSAGQRDIASNGSRAGARHAAVFVPPENLAFWNIAVECRADPFFVPAILGVPMLKGLNPPALKCPKEPNYGFTNYKDSKLRTVERPATLRPGCTLEFGYGIDTRRRPPLAEKSAAVEKCIRSVWSKSQDGSQPIASSFVGGATRGRPIRSQIAPWPAALRDALIQLSGTGINQGDLPRLAR